MHKSIVLISLLALLAVSPAQAAPTQITACGTISQSGSYVLDQNLSASSGTCLVIAARQVTIDLAGFTITCESGGFVCNGPGAGIRATNGADITVRNGNIVGFESGVDLLGGSGNVVEGLRVSAERAGVGIRADGVVKDNEVSANGNGIIATGRVTGNVVLSLNGTTMEVTFPGSIVIGNTVLPSSQAPAGLSVRCPANVTDNLITGNRQNLVLEGQGCINTNNVAP
jgi:hypothetical protein